MAWQAAALASGSLAFTVLGQGSVPSLLFGGGVMLGSLILQRFAVSMALRAERKPAIAILLMFAKLAAVLALIYVGFHTEWLAPMSFAAGITSLPLAIVLDVCYLEWVAPKLRANPQKEDAR